MRKRDEPVRLTKIYTRGGDAGETSLGDGSRVAKTDVRLAAIGDVDELNSFVGWAAAAAGEELRVVLTQVQNDLFDVGADLSVPRGDALRVDQNQVGRLERACDDWNARLEPLKSFVLPGGSEAAARLFVARAVCRRAERTVLALDERSELVAVYLNRLSDLLFILARAANAGGNEQLWRPGATQPV